MHLVKDIEAVAVAEAVVLGKIKSEMDMRVGIRSSMEINTISKTSIRARGAVTTVDRAEIMSNA